MAIFWVNQGDNFAIEQEECRLNYDPIGNKGHHKPGYKNISNVRYGDFILHNDNSFIRAISVATSDCYIIRKEIAGQGTDLLSPDDTWDDYVFCVDVSFVELDQPLNIRSCRSWLMKNHDSKSAFDVTGKPKEPYIHRIADTHVAYLMQMALELPLSEKAQQAVVEVLDEVKAQTLPDEKLREKAIAEQYRHESPQRIMTTWWYRSPYIAQEAKRKAHGICQLCGQPAPFKDANNQPYLECHHIKWRSQGGEDCLENVVALCPNCHRKMHIRNDPKDVQLLLSRAAKP